jgi:methyl-accepting chemotaxis protein
MNTSLLAKSWRDADRLLTYLLIAHLPVALALAPWHGAWLPAIVVGGLATGITVVVTRRYPGTLLSRLSVASALMTYSALFIWEGGGMIEFHFHIFAALAFLLLYRDWRVPLWAAAVIAVHHAVFNVLQEAGVANDAVFRNEQGIKIVAIHASFVIFETAVLVYISHLLAAERVEAQQVVTLAERLSARDLRIVRPAGQTFGDATEAMLRGVESVATLVAAVRRSVDSLAASSQEIAAAADESGRAIGEMAGAVTTINEGAQRQVGAVDGARRAAVEMVSMVDSSADNAEETARVARDTQTLAEEGLQAAVEASTVMGAVQDSSQRATGVIGELQEKSAQIGPIADSITSIASQTNLLALNAAIEAARAGEHGRGFAVVAEEVRALAVEASEAAGRISKLLAEVQEATGEAVSSVQQGATQIESGAATVEQAREAFSQIGTSVEDVTGRVGEIAAAITQLRAETHRVHGEVDDIAGVAAGFSSASDEVAGSARNTASSADQIAHATRGVAATVEELAELLSTFELAE